jgi:hypothetical protein
MGKYGGDYSFFDSQNHPDDLLRDSFDFDIESDISEEDTKETEKIAGSLSMSEKEDNDELEEETKEEDNDELEEETKEEDNDELEEESKEEDNDELEEESKEDKIAGSLSMGEKEDGGELEEEITSDELYTNISEPIISMSNNKSNKNEKSVKNIYRDLHGM